jgi:hypothetical protein
MIDENAENKDQDSRIKEYVEMRAEGFVEDFPEKSLITREWSAVAYVEMDRDLQIYITFEELFNWLKGTTGGIITNKLMAWREGDEITRNHREMLAVHYIIDAKVRTGKEIEVYEKYLAEDESAIADMLAVSIAIYRGMDADTFKQHFPTIANECNTPVATNFLASIASDADDIGYWQELFLD